MSEFDRNPVEPSALQPARYFAAGYAGEHVAGTEFVIGATFVTWGVTTGDVIWGLLIGNALAVLTWALICAPIAVQTRLTLYAYLEKIAGPGVVKLYSVVNGILFCVLAGAMITVSASAVRILFGIPAQVNWYPTSFAFVAVALAVGAVVVLVAVQGFRALSRFAEMLAPWMVTMFFVGAIAALPLLVLATPGVASIQSLDDFWAVADQQIYNGTSSELTMWHVAAFAWICNFAMHGSLSDMTMLRFAKRSWYGYLSAFGMFVGHYAAWVCAGIMGAAAALAAGGAISSLDAGEVAFQTLGAIGIVAVIIAGWTTSNPTIYRAGLAFQSLNPSWKREHVTLIVGVITTIIACFPFVFTKLLDFVGLMALVLAPIGGVIFAEHWLFRPLGLTRYWNKYKGGPVNFAALLAWLGALILAFALTSAGVHLYFTPPIIWVAGGALYLALAALLGARSNYGEVAAEEDRLEAQRRAVEAEFLDKSHMENGSGGGQFVARFVVLACFASLIASLGLAIASYQGVLPGSFKQLIILPSALYFALVGYLAIQTRRPAEVRST